MSSGVRGEADVVVVGAGAAGLAAAAHLRAKQPSLHVMLIEAGARIGGRAHSLRPGKLDVPVDLGCGWLHGARTNPWTRIAGNLGLAIDRTPAPWDNGGRELGLAPEDRNDCDAALGRFFARVEAWPADRSDCALSALLEPGNRWNDLIDAIGTFINGAELARASVRDYQRYDPGPGPDWRVLDGYGHLVESFGAGLPVVLETAVSGIDHSGRERIRIETTAGPISARAAIVTVSTNVLAAGAIGFTPAMPDKLAAAAGLPLGLANKLFFAVGRAQDLPRDGHLMGSPERTGTGAYQIRPSGQPVIEAYFAGELAEHLERQGQAAAVAFARDELAGYFGAGLAGRLSPVAVSCWRADPLFKGSYSYAKPGASDCRAALAAPVDGRLFFAGEACSPRAFSTAGGAYESGVTAAAGVLASLRPGSKRQVLEA